MFDFVQNLIYTFLTIQEKFLKKDSKKNFKNVYSNSTSKRAFGSSASLEFNLKTKENIHKVENSVKNIIKKFGNNPQKLLEFIEKNDTKVYKIPFADKFLALINYEEGFIAQSRGVKALYLNLIISLFSGKKRNLNLKTDAMFILRNLPLDNYFMIQQFHKWYSMKLNLPGFDAQSQDNFQKYLNSENQNVKSLSIDEIFGLKEAIARDVEAIDFILDFAKSTAGAKNALKKMSTGGASV
jgi:hypothetical protein